MEAAVAVVEEEEEAAAGVAGAAGGLGHGTATSAHRAQLAQGLSSEIEACRRSANDERVEDHRSD